MTTKFFTVDSALLAELGERLVGQSHIALAELVKNAYDADATACEIEVEHDRIVVRDDGHGMTPDEFESFWLRIGTRHKEREGYSRSKKRRVTGSKGIGRLAVQFLGSEVVLHTRSSRRDSPCLEASVDWIIAVQKGELTKAPVAVDYSAPTRHFAKGRRHGFEVEVKGLTKVWTEDDFKLLAQQIWTLRSPFEGDSASERDFRIDLVATDESSREAFEKRLKQVMESWGARIRVSLKDGLSGAKAKMTVNIRSNFIREGTRGVNAKDSHFSTEASLPVYSREDNIPSQPVPLLDEVQCDIRIYRLTGVQRGGLDVGDLNDYLSKFGGVLIYDSGFRLPYYGVEQDWLYLDRDNARRLSVSQMLPKGLQVPNMMHDLPSQKRMLGVVEVSTSHEATSSGSGEVQPLMINPGRDRLNNNEAYKQLHNLVRWAIDYYVSCYNKTQFSAREERRPSEPLEQKESRLTSLLDQHREEIPEPVYIELDRQIKDYAEAIRGEKSYRLGAATLLGPLATAGMAALALDHEVSRLVPLTNDRLDELASIGRDLRVKRIVDIVDELRDANNQLEANRSLFTPLIREDDRETGAEYSARSVVTDVIGAMEPFYNRATVTADKVPDDIRLPTAPLAAWNAVFQNLIANALNATLDAGQRKICFDGKADKRGTNWIRISDTGVGLSTSIEKANATLFEPFARRLKVSRARDSLRLGGYGLGLTIVRMIANDHGAEIAFGPPLSGFKTALTLSWKTT